MKKLLTVLCVMILTQIVVSSTTVLHADSYIYNHYNEIVPIVPPFTFERMIQKEDLVNPETGLRPLRFEVIRDVHVGEDYIYIVDSGDGGVFGQVVVLDKNYQFVTNISNIYDDTGEQVMVEKVSESGAVSMVQLSLSSGGPSSVYETETGKLYIALQHAQRIVVLDTTDLVENKFGELTFAYIEDFTSPENLIGATGFEPYKIVVDRAERMYVIVESGREGMLELNADGSFSRYYGTNPPNVNLLDFFWRQFMSDIQLEQVDRIYAPPFSGVAIDSDGFKYAITNSDDTDQMVYRFNSSGNDVLREMGNTPPIGDVATFSDEGLERSTFVSITVNEFGTYAVLDETKGRIFVYNFDGELLFAFGGLGEETGLFHTPTGIAWDGDKLIVTDMEYRTVTVFKPTDFGEKVLRATEAYHTGNFALAGELWEDVVVLNSNYEIAYVGIGKKFLLEKDYQQAIEYFELGHSRTYHSMAFEEYRNEQLEDHFLLFSTPILFLMGYVIYTEVRYSRKMGE